MYTKTILPVNTEYGYYDGFSLDPGESGELAPVPFPGVRGLSGFDSSTALMNVFMFPGEKIGDALGWARQGDTDTTRMAASAAAWALGAWFLFGGRR